MATWSCLQKRVKHTHVKTPNLTALKSIFAAWFKNEFVLCWQFTLDNSEWGDFYCNSSTKVVI